MSGSLFPTPQQWFDNNGNPLANGTVTTYIAGTSTLKATYSDYMLTTPNTNPVVLDAAGRATIWGDGGYKLVIKTDAGATLYTQDNVYVTGNNIEGDVTITGDLAVGGGVTIDAGPTNINGGRVVIDTTSYVPTVTDPYAFYTVNSNAYTNANTYGSGAWMFDRPAIDCNQPNVFVRNNISTTSFGNNAWLEMINLGGQAGSNPNFVPTVPTGGSVEMVAVNDSHGAIKTVTITSGGTGYVNGTYTKAVITRTTGNGVSAYANVTVSGGIVTSVTIDMIGGVYVGQGGGSAWKVNDIFTIANTQLGGSGSGFAGYIASIVAYNGKLKFGIVSGKTNSFDISADGYHYMGSRRSCLSPSGVNSGFETNFRFYALSPVGKGWMISQGAGIQIDPTYDLGIDSQVKVLSDYRGANITVQSSTGTFDATLVVNGTGSGNADVKGIEDSYIRSESTTGTSAIYAQTDTANKNATVEIRSNWTAAGTGSAVLNLYTDNVAGADGFRIQANGVNGRLNIRLVTDGAIQESVDIDPSQDGLLSVYQNSDYTLGRIRLGNGSGAAAGGTLAYDSNTGILSISGTNNYISMGSSGVIRPDRLLYVSAANGATTAIGAQYTDVVLDNAGIATHTVTFPAAPPNNTKIAVAAGTGAIAALTVASAGTDTFSGAPTSLAASGFFTMIYRTSGTKWWRVG